MEAGLVSDEPLGGISHPDLGKTLWPSLSPESRKQLTYIIDVYVFVHINHKLAFWMNLKYEMAN